MRGGALVAAPPDCDTSDGSVLHVVVMSPAPGGGNIMNTGLPVSSLVGGIGGVRLPTSNGAVLVGGGNVVLTRRSSRGALGPVSSVRPTLAAAILGGVVGTGRVLGVAFRDSRRGGDV